MRKTILLLAPLFILSCSDKLTESKAKKIIESCFKEQNKVNKVKINTGDNVFLSNQDDTIKYKKLANEGYLLFNKLPRKQFQWSDRYKVSLTEKAKPFIEETKDDYSTVRISTPKIEKVKYVTEVPAMGGVEAKVEIKNYDLTPFNILSNDAKEFEIKTFPLMKTSDGWKYCDN